MQIKQSLEQTKKNLRLFFLPAEENDGQAKIFSGNFLIFFLVAAAVLKLGFTLFIYSFSNSSLYADITKTALVQMANDERARQSLPPLAENPVLERAAYMKALDMAQNGYFNHVSPSGVSPWHWLDQAGYGYKYAGENLAIGFVDSSEVQSAWVASPTHQANIVNNKYKEIGIAVLKANFQGNPATIVVQMFGTKTIKNKTAQNAAAASSNTNQEPVPPAIAPTSDVLGASTVAPESGASNLEAFFFWQEIFNILQTAIWSSLIFVILLLVANFALKADLRHADLLVKVGGFIAIMVVLGLLDQAMISALIPRNSLI